MRYFQDSNDIKVALVLSNNPNAGGLEIAKQYDVPTIVVRKDQFNDPDYLLPLLEEKHIDLVVLAGFLRLVPDFLVKAYYHEIINIHPALLPKYGGKGMYGIKVHHAVLANKEPESGITIHYVDPNYDEGKIIFQAKCVVEANDTAETLSVKVLKLEHEWYSKIIEKLLLQNE